MVTIMFSMIIILIGLSIMFSNAPRKVIIIIGAVPELVVEEAANNNLMMCSYSIILSLVDGLFVLFGVMMDCCIF